MNGILNLNKPSGLSSARAVAHVKRFLPRGTKIGHAGTLDPFATGVILLLVGRGTKLCESLMNEQKEYQATVQLGSTTATDDKDSPKICWPGLIDGIKPVIQSDIENILPQFTGKILQTPPIFSAIKVGGRRAYQLARNNVIPELTPRHVMVYRIDIIDYIWPFLKIHVTCGRGTYIRALARDIGKVLNVGGHLTQLCRTRIGPFTLESAATLAELSPSVVAEKLVPIESVCKKSFNEIS